MIEVTGERYIDALSEQVWMFVEDVRRLPDWLAFADSAELIEGEGVGRRQRLHSCHGKKRACVDQVVTQYEPARLLVWRRESELIDGRSVDCKPGASIFVIRLIPEGGGTRVRLESRQESAGPLRAAACRIHGNRGLARQIEQSLHRLECLLTGKRSTSGAL